MSTTSGHESLEQLSQDVSIKNELRDFRNILDTLAKNGKITPTEKDEFTREWLGVDPDKIDERANGLVDKYVQELIKTAQEKRLDKDGAKRAVISKLKGFKTLSSGSSIARESLGVKEDAPMVEVLRKATDGLRANVKEREKDTASAQVTPANPVPAPAQEVKPKSEIPTPPAPAPAQVTPAKSAPAPVPPSAPTTPPVQSTPAPAPAQEVKPPVEPAKVVPAPSVPAKPVDKPVMPSAEKKQPAVVPKVIPVIEPTAVKQPALIQKSVSTAEGKKINPWDKAEKEITNILIKSDLISDLDNFTTEKARAILSRYKNVPYSKDFWKKDEAYVLTVAIQY
ncbi:MAG: hypothetical protein Q8K26_03075, partial [Candidatus Gracilibacteria bacterium]|nr:hypothetical protein [Candidatus Gracilibacteria bacterium]